MKDLMEKAFEQTITNCANAVIDALKADPEYDTYSWEDKVENVYIIATLYMLRMVAEDKIELTREEITQLSAENCMVIVETLNIVMRLMVQE